VTGTQPLEQNLPREYDRLAPSPAGQMIIDEGNNQPLQGLPNKNKIKNRKTKGDKKEGFVPDG
jgi:hypothetical protein